MTKLLFISYHFPPQGGGGVQRSLKFVKYLPEFGIQPVVLTDGSKRFGRWTPPDPTLLDELRPDITVYRHEWPAVSHKKKRSYDHASSALLEHAIQIGRLESVDAILVSMSPFEDAYLASNISKELGIPWIADLRDPWALDEFQTYRTGFHRWLVRRNMRQALAGASCVIMNTPEAGARLVEEFPEFAYKNTTYITNGFDQEDFSGVTHDNQLLLLDHGKLNIVHTGTCHTGLGLRQRKLHLINQLLRRSSPGVETLPRSPYYLFHALGLLKRIHPHAYRDFNIILVGTMDDSDRQLIKDLHLEDAVTCTGYVAHATSIRYLLGADLLFLPMHHISPGNRATIIPGKTYEYLASGKPILAAVPAGDARSILTRAGDSAICDPKDFAAMAEYLQRMHVLWINGHLNSARDNDNGPRDVDFVARFERRVLTERLATVVKEVLGIHNGVGNTEICVSR